jgi:hypothetical protein
MPGMGVSFRVTDAGSIPFHAECASAGVSCGLCMYIRTCPATNGGAYPKLDYLTGRFDDIAAKELLEKWQLL